MSFQNQVARKQSLETRLKEKLTGILSCMTVAPVVQREIIRPPMQESQSHAGLIPGRSPGVGNGNALQYSCLESSMDRGAWGYSSWGYSSLTRLSTAPNLGRALFLLHRFPSPPSLIHPVLHPYSVFSFFSLLCTFSIRQSRTC